MAKASQVVIMEGEYYIIKSPNVIVTGRYTNAVEGLVKQA